MITLKLVSYNKREVATIENLLLRMHLELLQTCIDESYQCRTCPIKHICTDIVSAKAYAEDVLDKRNRGNK